MSDPQIEYWTDANAIALRNSLIVRPFSVLTGSWTTLRVGLLLSITSGSMANMISTPRFAVGICSGSTNVFGDAVCGHFLGYRSNNATWTYFSSSVKIGHGWSQNDGRWIRRSSGSSDFVSADNFSTAGPHYMVEYNSASVLRGKSIFCINFERSTSPAVISCSGWVPVTQSATSHFETTSSLLRTLLEGGTFFGSSGQINDIGIPVNEALSGSFNAVNIAWDREDPLSCMLIYAIGVAVVN